MSILKQDSRRVALLALTLAVAVTPLVGCDSSTPSNAPFKPSGVSNPSPDNKLSDITTENESANMDRLRKAGAAK